jgi:hypothetical protein
MVDTDRKITRQISLSLQTASKQSTLMQFNQIQRNLQISTDLEIISNSKRILQISTYLKMVKESNIKKNKTHKASTTHRRHQIQHQHIIISTPHHHNNISSPPPTTTTSTQHQ